MIVPQKYVSPLANRPPTPSPNPLLLSPPAKPASLEQGPHVVVDGSLLFSGESNVLYDALLNKLAQTEAVARAKVGSAAMPSTARRTA